MESRQRTIGDRERVASDERNPSTGTEHSTWRHSALKMRTWFAGIAVVMCTFVTVVFIRLGSVPFAAVLGVIGLISLVDFGWVLYLRHRSEPG
jgi:hypothetical protein